MWHDIIIYTPMYVTFFWAIVLLISKHENNRAKFFLGIFMTIAFLLYLSHAHFFKKIISTYHFFDSIYIFASLSVYPLYYWYIKLLSVETSYRWSNLKLFVPAVIFALISVIVYQLMSDEERMNYVNEILLGKEINTPISIKLKIQKISFIISRFVFVIQILFFLLLGQKLVKRYNNKIANFYSNLESRTILWINIFFYSFVLTSFLSIVFNIIGRSFFMESTLLLLIPSVIFSVLLFFIGLLGSMQNHTVVDLEQEEKENENIDTKSYNKNKLNDSLLELFINDAVYKNADLKITQVSEMLNTNRTYISKHINTEYSCTFNDFVNRYRIEESKRLLTDSLLKNYSLNYISEKSGFGSMGSFMRVFRSHVGMTPGQYREKNMVYEKEFQDLE